MIFTIAHWLKINQDISNKNDYAFLHMFKYVLNMLRLNVNCTSIHNWILKEEFYKDWNYCRICKDKERWKLNSAKI